MVENGLQNVNLCELFEKGAEGPIGSAIRNVLIPPDGTKFKIQNMEEEEKYFKFSLKVFKEGKPEEEEPCADTPSVEPLCPMSEDTLVDVTADNSVLEQHMQKLESMTLPLKNSEGEARKVKNVQMVESAEGTTMMYDNIITVCKTEDPSDCMEHSAGKCSFHVKLGFKDGKLTMLPASERGDQNTEADQPSGDHAAMCQETNSLLASVLGDLPLPMPVPGGLDNMVEIKIMPCKSQTIIMATTTMIDK